MPRSYTVAERQLLDDLEQLSITAPLEHVRRLRDLGLLPPPDEAGRYDPAACAPIVTAAGRARAENIGWDQIAAALFVQGCEVPLDPLKQAYRHQYAEITDDVPKDLPPDDVADYVVNRALPRTKRTRLGAQWIRRSREYGAREDGKVHIAALSMMTLLLHPAKAPFIDNKVLAEVAGMGDRGDDTIAIIAAIGGRDRILEYLEQATMHDLMQARELLASYADALDLLDDPAITSAHPGLTTADLRSLPEATVLVPVMNVLQRVVPNIETVLGKDKMS